jgi:hypothetical protein
MDTEQKTQIPPQQIVAKLARLSTLLQDVQKLAEEYNEAFISTISLRIKGTNMHETIRVECDNGYKVEFNTNTIYMYLETPKKGGYRIFQNGEAPVGLVKEVPLECWDRINTALEELIRRKLDEIAYMRNLYYTYTHTF